MRPFESHRAGALFVLASIALGASTADAQQQRQRYLLIDRDLRADAVDLVGIQDGWVDCLRSGLIDRRPMDDLLAILRVDEDEHSERFVTGDRFVELADGQRWVGAPEPSRRAEHMGWRIDRIGSLSAPLEKVLRARLVEGAPLLEYQPNAAEERLLLANGDALSGLLVSIGDRVEFEASGSSEPTLLPVHQVASLALVNPRERSTGMMLWLADGSVVRADECRWSPSSFQFTTSSDGIRCSVETGMLRGISFAAERLMPLAQLEPEISHQSQWLRVVERPTVLNAQCAVGLADVQMRGPLVARYVLPERAARFYSTAIVPRFASDWADLTITVLVDDRVVLEVGMDGTGRSRREIDVPLEGAHSLTIQIDEGGRGPIQDVIILQRPMLLFD